MIDFALAKELAQHVADHESKQLDPHEYYVIVDEFAHERPWGWIFEPAMEPYRSTGMLCLRAGAWCLSVDRFSGKVQVSSRAAWRADQWPIIELHLKGAGENPLEVYFLLRQFKGWTASMTKSALAQLPLLIASGSQTSIAAIAQALTNRGAIVELRQQHA